MVTCAIWPPPFGGGRFALPPMAGQRIRAGAPNRANLRQPVRGTPRRFRRHAPCYASAHGTRERSDGKGAAGARGVPRHGAGGGGVPHGRAAITPIRDALAPPELAATIAALPEAALRARLYVAFADAPPVTLTDLVPPDVPPLSEVIFGTHSRLAFALFEKRLCR